MKSKTLRSTAVSAAALLAVAILVSGLASCANRLGMPDPETVVQLSAGEIGRSESLVVIFAKPWGESLEAAGLLETWPQVDGTASWQNPYTLVFQPAGLLPPDSRFQANVEFPDDPKFEGASSFSFDFHTPPITITPANLTIEYEDPAFADGLVASGEFVFSDAVTPDEAYSLVTATMQGSELDLNLFGKAASKTFPFRIEGLSRKTSASAIKFGYKNSALRVSRAEPAELKIPALGDFSVMDIRLRDFGGPAIEIIFSEPLDENQDFRGLVRLAAADASGSTDDAGGGSFGDAVAALPVNLSFVPRSNLLRVFPSDELPSEFNLTVEPGIKSHDGAVLVQQRTETVTLATELPEVRFVGTGTIVPDGSNAYIPVETRNLKALMIQAIKIPDNNYHQFTQDNSISGTSNLQRVGNVVWQKVVDLGWRADNTNRWVRRGLDVSELVRKFDPGLYHIVLTFRRPHIVYNTAQDFSADKIDFPFWPDMPNQTSQYSYWDNWENYNEMWNNRRNPTHAGYYYNFYDHNITVGKNLFVSTLAPNAQLDAGGNFRVQLLNLITTTPVEGATVEVFNYQNTKLATGRTDNLGSWSTKLSGTPRPFTVRFTKGSDIAFLRLSPGDELNVSHFDVGGVKDEVAVQGVLYGERDVWRPGDTMYLTFVLRDRFRELPANHPVTLTIRSPRGSEVYKMTKTQQVQGMYAFPVATAPEYETGNYTARIQVGSHEFIRTLRLETIVPNRLKIDVKANESNGVLVGGRLRGEVSAAWLHGAVAGNLLVEIEARLTPNVTSFGRFNGYSFDDPTKSVPTSPIEVLRSTLDAQGNAFFDKQISSLGLPGVVGAQLTTRVYEPGGSFSVEYATTKVSPYQGYAGVRVPPGDASRGMLLTDTDHRVDLALVDENGNPRNGSVRVELYKMNWQWWWETNASNQANFFSTQNSTPLKTETVTIRNGIGQTTMRVNYPDWGRYGVFVTDLETGHRAARVFYIDWPGWAGRAMAGPGDAPSVLSLTPQKSTYNVGETAVVNLPLGDAGRALATVEANGRIVAQSWIQPRGASTQYSFQVSADMLPNAYVHVTYIQPYSSGNDRPLRSVGVVPVEVRDTQTELRPVLTAPVEVQPGSTMTIKVREASGKAMGYTVAIVDEGLLGLTRFQTPNLWNGFYARTASLLRHFDIYNQVGGMPSGTLASLIGVGGGDAALDGGRESQNRWKPVAIYQEPRMLAPGAENTHTFEIPEYLGAVRVMVVAADQSSAKPAFGRTDASVFVRKPLMVLGTVPRVLTPGDEITLPVNIFTNGLGRSSTRIEMLTEGKITPLGSTSQLLTTLADGEYNALFRARVAAETGEAKITFRAYNGSLVSEHSISVEVRVPSVPESRTVSVAVNPGQTLTIPLQLFGVTGTNEIFAEFSNFRPIDLERRLGYLIRYPYGCVEQTTSALFPQLYLSDLTNLTNEQRQEIGRNINVGVTRLQQFQNSTGGFNYWIGSSEVAPEWTTVYVGHFLVQARARGYNVPASMLDGWLQYQRGKANSAPIRQHWEQIEQAYRLYVLALAGQPDMSAMNRLSQASGLHELAKLRLASAYSLAGSNTQASSLMSSTSSPSMNYTNRELLYGSLYRDMAMAMQTYIQLGNLTAARPYADQISDALAAPTHYSTQSLAFMLMSMADYAKAVGVGQPVNASVTWRGQQTNVTGSAFVVSQKLNTQGLGAQAASVTVRNNSDVASNARFILRGSPMPKDVRASNNGLAVSMRYMAGGGPIDPAQGVSVGEEVTIAVTVTNTGRTALKEVALNLLIPSGLELVNTRLTGGSTSRTTLRYQDFRDDRVFSFFDLPANGAANFEFRAIGAYQGTYYVPGASAEVMYEPTINGTAAGSELRVVPFIARPNGK